MTKFTPIAGEPTRTRRPVDDRPDLPSPFRHASLRPDWTRFAVRLALVSLLATLSACASARAGDEEINYDEAKVPPYVLPDPLTMQNGTRVTSPALWQMRRAELLQLFRTQIYGQRPPDPQRIQFRVSETAPAPLRDKAVRKRIGVEIYGRTGMLPIMTITLYLPCHAPRPVPVFVGMHLFDSAAEAPLPGQPLLDDVGLSLPGARLLETILERGYAIATLDAADFCPDDKERFRQGVLNILYPNRFGPPGPSEPGAITTWAWALSRAIDYFECDRQIDARRVAVIGHSRMGKTALWAGAEDPRFALVISNNSGCAGAALSRRQYGETVERITRVFPHWFCGNFASYGQREAALPVDQHELVSLIAPRPVYIASAQNDRWADPQGEFLSAVAAEPVYRLLGKTGLGTNQLPEPNRSIGGSIGYHLRVGQHDLTDFDWLMYLDFADRHFGRRASPALMNSNKN